MKIVALCECTEEEKVKKTLTELAWNRNLYFIDFCPPKKMRKVKFEKNSICNSPK